MLWWLFWASLLQRHAASVGMPPVGGMVGQPAARATRRCRALRKPAAASARGSRQAGSPLRLICVDGVRVDRVAV